MGGERQAERGGGKRREGWRETTRRRLTRRRYLPLQIWYLTSPRSSAASPPQPISTPASTCAPSLRPLSSLFTSVDLSFCHIFHFPPVDQTPDSYLCSSGLLTLYMSIIHIAFHMHVLAHCLHQWFPTCVACETLKQSDVCLCIPIAQVAHVCQLFPVHQKTDFSSLFCLTLFFKRPETATYIQ